MTTVDDLAQMRSSLQSLKRLIANEDRDRIARRALRDEAERLSTQWFSEVAPQLEVTTLSADLVRRYSDGFSPSQAQRTQRQQEGLHRGARWAHKALAR